MKQKTVAGLLEEEKAGWWESVVSHAPSIIGVFANFVVIFADIRAFDVIYQLTGIWWKALAASLACAVPFILWEIGWQYNHTSDNWRKASLAMAGIAFLTSIVLGVADYVGMTSPEWADFLLAAVVILTGAHTVVGFLYYYNDPDVARKRRKAQAMAQMLDQETNAQVARQLLASGKTLLEVISGLENQYDPDDVEAVLRILQGKKKDKPSEKFDNRPAKPIAPRNPNLQTGLVAAKDVRVEELAENAPYAGRKDWDCLHCGNVNLGVSSSCKKCGEPRGTDPNARGGGKQ